MNRKLHRYSAKAADRIFWTTEIVGIVAIIFIQRNGYAENGKDLIMWLIAALLVYSGVRRVIKGPAVGVAVLECSADMLIFRNPSSFPAKVDRIALDKIHSIRLNGERHLRYFDCKLMSGEVQRVGPFERGQGELAVADWFREVLPDLPFLVDPSATPMARMEARPPEL
jgi:hypothetical protein